MRVLFLTSEFPPYSGGVGEYAYQVSSRLCTEYIYDILVLASKNHFDLNEIQKFDTNFPGKIIRYPEIPLLKIKFIYYPITAFYRFLKSIIHYILFKPDIIIACDGRSAQIALFIKSLLGAQYIVIGHGTEFLKHSPLYCKALKNASHIILNSELTRSFLKKNYELSDVKKTIVPLGADELFYDPDQPGIAGVAADLRKRLSIPEQTLIILTVGTISDRKGQDLVIQALSELPNEFRKRLVYIAAGRVTDKSILELPRQMAVEERVIFPGFIPREELPALYYLADVYVQPSRISEKLSSLEGFSISTCEALMMRKPVIVTDSVGIQEVIRLTGAGFVINSDNSEELRKLISLLVSDETLRSHLGKNAFEVAHSTLTWTSATQRFSSLLNESIINTK